MEHGNWSTIESDPGVFTELIRSFGVSGLEVEEVWDLEYYAASASSDIFGFIFLFKYDTSIGDTRNPLPWDSVPEVFFANQVINNACATQAILSVLLNAPESVNIGPELAQFKEFTAAFDPELKGISITNSDTMRNVHNSFARPDPFVNEGPVPDEDKEDNFHFIAFIPKKGQIYELDGLKPGPIKVAEFANGTPWAQALVPVIQQRIAQFASTEIRFNLMSVIRAKHDALQEQMAHIEQRMSRMDLDDRARAQLEHERMALLDQLTAEQEKHEKYKRENMRRRHNYLPLILELAKQMAQQGRLVPAVEESKRIMNQRREAALKNKRSKSP